MSIKIGNIYWFKYSGYKQDPRPLALILWNGISFAENGLVHALNLSYLSKKLTDDVVDMISQIASGSLQMQNTRTLYYDHLKRKLHPVVQAAYRTYHPNKMRNIQIVSKGFNETTSFINTMQKKAGIPSKKNTKNINILVKKKIEALDDAKRLINYPNGLSHDEAEQRAREYIKAVQEIKNPAKIDNSLFTLLTRKKSG